MINFVTIMLPILMILLLYIGYQLVMAGRIAKSTAIKTYTVNVLSKSPIGFIPPRTDISNIQKQLRQEYSGKHFLCLTIRQAITFAANSRKTKTTHTL